MNGREVAVLRQLSRVYPDGLDAGQLIRGSRGVLTPRNIHGSLSGLAGRRLISGCTAVTVTTTGTAPRDVDAVSLVSCELQYHLTDDGRVILDSPDAIIAMAEQHMTYGDRAIIHGPWFLLIAAVHAALSGLGAGSWAFALLYVLAAPVALVMLALISLPWLRRRQSDLDVDITGVARARVLPPRSREGVTAHGDESERA